jgi:hypothetical protein
LDSSTAFLAEDSTLYIYLVVNLYNHPIGNPALRPGRRAGL